MAKKLSLGILVSGNGSNLQAIIDNIKSKKLAALIKIVISDNLDAYALRRAEAEKLPTAVFVRKKFRNRADFESTIANKIKDHGVQLICLAGFMRILSPWFLRQFPQKIINIHPALLPSFPGLHAQKQALDHGVRISGCTVHFVDEGADTGPIIMQTAVPIKEGDSVETLTERILAEEHKIYSKAIQLFVEDRLEIHGRHVVVREKP